MNRLFERLAGLTNGKALILGVMLGLAYYFGGYNDGSALEAQIQVVNKKLAEAEGKKKETDGLLKEEARMKEAVGKLSEEYAFISKKLPSDLKSAEMVRSIDNVAKISGVSIKMKRPGTIEKKEVVEELPVAVIFEGNYGQIASFIYHISNLERLSRFMNFTISAVDDKKTLKVDGVVISYKLAPEIEVKPDAAAAAAGAPPPDAGKPAGAP